MSVTLTSIYTYPLKSGAAVTLERALVEQRGLAGDRRWMVIDVTGRFLTGRQLPQLTLIRAAPHSLGLMLSAPGMPDLTLSEPSTAAKREQVTVWSDACAATLADPAANEWISIYLNKDCRLVHMDADCVRSVSKEYSKLDNEVSFADAYPVLLISQAALDLLNGKLRFPISMLRFRPNLVVAGTKPHAEDNWKQIRIGNVEFDVVKPCTRCVFTTVDFELGRFADDGEPLQTLKTYRRSASGIH